jgi:hypothetical protein
LFEAAIDAKADTYALGVAEPILQNQVPRDNAAAVTAEEEQIISSDTEDENDEANVLTTDAQLPRSQQAHVFAMAGDAFARLGRTGDALSHYQTARSLEKTAIIRKDLRVKITAMKSILSTERENAARQPILHEALEQDRVVRPRLLAKGTSTPPANVGKGGRVQ